MTVSTIIAHKGRNVVTSSPEASLSDICGLLETHGIGAVVITTDDGKVAGIFSERDFMRALARNGAIALDRPVSAYMTSKVETCRMDDPIAVLMQKMTDGKFRHLPVIESGRLAGIVSIGDVVKARISEAEAESRAMREYITTA